MSSLLVVCLGWLRYKIFVLVGVFRNFAFSSRHNVDCFSSSGLVIYGNRHSKYFTLAEVTEKPSGLSLIFRYFCSWWSGFLNELIWFIA